MFIADDAPNANQAPSGAAWLRFITYPSPYFGCIFVPLLTELGWHRHGSFYRHGAPNGAFSGSNSTENSRRQ
jgi:hypothetical protein